MKFPFQQLHATKMREKTQQQEMRKIQLNILLNDILYIDMAVNLLDVCVCVSTPEHRVQWNRWNYN